MKNFKVPDWWDSIRATLALMLCSSYCIGVFISDIPAEKLTGLKELALLALTFYFLKRRPVEEGKTTEEK